MQFVNHAYAYYLISCTHPVCGSPYKMVFGLAKIISGMKERYDLNTKKIDSLNICRHFWNDGTQTKLPELNVIHDSMVFVYDRCGLYIGINTSLNKRLYPLYLIRMNQDSIVIARWELRTLQNNYTAVQRYIYTNYFAKQIDPVNRTSVQLLKQNKSLIKRIAKLSTYNDEEKTCIMQKIKNCTINLWKLQNALK
jgi:hypothetical protein